MDFNRSWLRVVILVDFRLVLAIVVLILYGAAASVAHNRLVGRNHQAVFLTYFSSLA